MSSREEWGEVTRGLASTLAVVAGRMPSFSRVGDCHLEGWAVTRP